MTIKIFIDQTCIHESRRIIRGKGDRGKNCPVGLALKSAGVEFRTVATSWVAFGKGDHSIQEQLPDPVRSFIADFDCGQMVTPLRFNLKVPDAFVHPDSPALANFDDLPTLSMPD